MVIRRSSGLLLIEEPLEKVATLIIAHGHDHAMRRLAPGRKRQQWSQREQELFSHEAERRHCIDHHHRRCGQTMPPKLACEPSDGFVSLIVHGPVIRDVDAPSRQSQA